MNIHSYQTIHGYHIINLTLAESSSATGSPFDQQLANQHYEDLKLHRSSTKKLNQIKNTKTTVENNSTQITIIIVHYNM